MAFMIRQLSPYLFISFITQTIESFDFRVISDMRLDVPSPFCMLGSFCFETPWSPSVGFKSLPNPLSAFGSSLSLIHSHSEAANPTTIIRIDVAADTGTKDARDDQSAVFATLKT